MVSDATTRVRFELNLDRRQASLVAVLVGQAVWLGTVMLRGWYSGPDLANLEAATGRPLDGAYLSESLGGHFGAPARFVYWLLERMAPLSWSLTVGIRLALQLAATDLLWRLLEDLFGARRWIPWLMALYALSPLLVPATAVLSNGLGLSVAQTCVLGALLLHVRYVCGGPAWQAVVAALLCLVAMSFADQAVTIVILLPALSLGWLHSGSLRERVRASASRWVTWAASGVAVLLFAIAYLSGDYTGRPASFSLADGWDVVRTEWTQVIGPAFLGGPWDWGANEHDWVSFATPPTVLEVLGQIALISLIVISVGRNGRKALLAWALPIGTTLLGVVLVAFGRSDYLGTFIAPIYRYSFFLPMTLVLGLALAFAGDEHDDETPSSRTLRGATALVAIASLVSGLVFADRFWQNPSRDYVDTLLASVRAAGPTVELYDSTVPEGVIPGLEPNHFVSDVLALGRLSATFGGTSPSPMLADDSGHLKPATLYHVGDITSSQEKECGTFVHGKGETAVTVGPVSRPADWYLELQLYEPRANTFSVAVLDAEGNELGVFAGGPNVQTSGPLVAVHRRIGVGTPAKVVIRSTDAETNFCLVHAYIGAPVLQ